MNSSRTKRFRFKLRNRKINKTSYKFAAVVSVLTTMGLGVVYSWTSPALPHLTSSASSFQISEIQGSWIVSLLSWGTIFGQIINPVLISRLGSKRTLLFLVIPQFISWSMIYFGRNWLLVCFARVIGGFGYGAGECSTAIYLSEIGDEGNRGIFLSLINLSINSGIFVTMIFGAFLSYDMMNLALMIAPIVFVLTFYAAPDTKRIGVDDFDDDVRERLTKNGIDDEESRIHNGNVQDSRKFVIDADVFRKDADGFKQHPNNLAYNTNNFYHHSDVLPEEADGLKQYPNDSEEISNCLDYHQEFLSENAEGLKCNCLNHVLPENKNGSKEHLINFTESKNSLFHNHLDVFVEFTNDSRKTLHHSTETANGSNNHPDFFAEGANGSKKSPDSFITTAIAGLASSDTQNVFMKEKNHFHKCTNGFNAKDSPQNTNSASKNLTTLRKSKYSNDDTQSIIPPFENGINEIITKWRGKKTKAETEALIKNTINKNFKKEKVEQDLNLLQRGSSCPSEKKSSTIVWWKLFMRKNNRNVLLIMTVVTLTDIFSGHMAIIRCTQQIFEYSGASFRAEYAALILAFLKIGASLISALVVEKFGRRNLFLSTGIFAGLSQGSVALFFFLKLYLEMDVSSIRWLPLFGVSMYEIVGSVGFSSLFYVYQGELFSDDVKGLGVTFTNIFYEFITFFLNLHFQIIIDAIGIYFVFFGFGICCVIGSCIVYWISPETKGKSNEEIRKLLS